MKRSTIRPTTTTTALTLLALAAALPAQADTRDHTLEISPFAGYHVFESNQNLENGLTYGVRLGYHFTRHWTVEGAVSMVNSAVDDAGITGASPGQFRSPADDVDLLLYQVDALYHFRPNNKLSPYLVGGYGAADYSPSISNKEMSTFNLGGGIKYWLTDTVALRLDVRDHFVSEVFDDGYHNISTTLGVSFAFGGNRTAKPQRATAPQPAQREAPPAQAPPAEVIVLEFEDIHFDFDRSTITPEARRILNNSISVLQNNPETKVRIAGYTSAAGTAEHNQGLSEDRATAIKQYLITDGGISEDRLSVIGYGNTRPARHESSPTTKNSLAAKENMRALFEIVVE